MLHYTLFPNCKQYWKSYELKCIDIIFPSLHTFFAIVERNVPNACWVFHFAHINAIAKADEDMAACGTDFSKANEIFAEKTKLEEKLEKLFEEWEELHS